MSPKPPTVHSMLDHVWYEIAESAGEWEQCVCGDIRRIWPEATQ